MRGGFFVAQGRQRVFLGAMRSKLEIIEALSHPGIIAVVRAQSAEQLPHICEALLSGGVHAIEITMTTPDAIGCIRRCAAAFGSSALIGVGTVLDDATCAAALDAGAEFVVSPVFRPGLVKRCASRDRPVMLGAYTPTEAQAAHDSGADFVKIFPADTLGPKYIKALLAPLPHLRIVPTGGVDAHNTADFLKAGCKAVGAGSSLLLPQCLKEGLWAELTQKAKEFVSAARSAGRNAHHTDA